MEIYCKCSFSSFMTQQLIVTRLNLLLSYDRSTYYYITLTCYYIIRSTYHAVNSRIYFEDFSQDKNKIYGAVVILAIYHNVISLYRIEFSVLYGKYCQDARAYFSQVFLINISNNSIATKTGESRNSKFKTM